MQFEGHVLRARDLEDGDLFGTEVERTVGGVLDDDEVVLLGEGDDFLVELTGGDGAGRVVWVVEDEHLGLGQDVGGNGLQVGQEVILGGELQVMDEAAVVLGVRAEHRVTRNGHEHIVARIDETAWEDRECGLRANRVEDFGVGVDRHAEEILHVAGGGLLEVRATVVGVAAILRLGSFGLERLHHHRERHLVGLTDAEVDQGDVRLGLLGGSLGALDLLELIDRGRLAVIDAADAFGEELLDVRVGHGDKALKRGGRRRMASGLRPRALP